MKKKEVETLMPLNLQFFGEQTEDEEKDAEDGRSELEKSDEDEELEEDSEEEVKTFTQTDVDKAIEKRLKRERRLNAKNNVLKEDKEAFEKWKVEHSKADENESSVIDNDEVSAIKKAQSEAESKLLAYERRDTVLEAGVDKKFAKFVVHEATAGMTDELDFEDALEEYLEKNAQYLEQKGKEEENEQGMKKLPKVSTKTSGKEKPEKKEFVPPKII